MPYKNILWIKLEKRLLNDYRFYTLPEDSQLLYVKLLMLSAETENKIPKNPDILHSCLRSKLTTERIIDCIKEIQSVFPKFKEKALHYYFSDWEYSHNLISKRKNREFPGNSRGTPKDGVEKTREEKTREEKKRIDKPQNHFSYLENIPEEDLNEFTFRFDASKHQVKSKGEDLANYCRANGKTKKYKDFKAFLVNALKKDFKELTEKQRKEREENQPRIEATIKKMSESKVESDVGTLNTPDATDTKNALSPEKLKELREKRNSLLKKVKT